MTQLIVDDIQTLAILVLTFAVALNWRRKR